MTSNMAYPAAIGLAVASTFIILLVLPPLCWHVKGHNIGASSVIIWVIIMNLMILTNAILWPDDNFDQHFNGVGLCDIEVKLQIASQVALPASFACILRALAAVMNTDNLTVSRLRKKTDTFIDMSWCIAFPLLQMLFHWIVQPGRYAIIGISGCSPIVDNSWLMVVLILIPPVIWILVCAFYAVLVIHRLYAYRKSFKAVLQHNNTNKSRFLRLFIICILWICCSVPVACYVFAVSFETPKTPFSWSDVHDPYYWRLRIVVPSNGIVLYDRYIWLGVGLCIFLFFGIGKDALSLYRQALGICVPGYRRQQGRQTVTDSYSSRARMVKSETMFSKDALESSIDLEAMQHQAI